MASSRRWWRRVHLWLGLSAGVLFVLLGLTGSVIVYEQELDAWLNPGLLKVRTSPARASIAVMEASARAALPASAELYAARLPFREGDASIWFYKSSAGERRQVAIDIHSGKVLGERSTDHHLVAWLYRFHASLLLGLPGNVFLSIVAVFLLMLLASGVWLWIPRRRHQWAQAFRVAWGRSPERTYFDLHRVAGAYSAPVLLVLAFTGIYMALPPLMEAAVSLVSPVTPWTIPAASGGPRKLSLEEAVLRAQREFPQARPKVLVLDRPGLYEISLFHPEDRLWRKFGERVVFVDASTAAVLDKRAPGDGSSGDRFIDWMFPLHNGEAFGEAGRALVFASGFAPLRLAIAGVALWRRRSRHSLPRGTKP
jgi:uncharacterized iron-regulated membrane protein